ncbi:hypothetical protein KMW28_15935 [Flammeovirga yaeyamensis]|uniref:Two component regulator three Y domain-containing protein n=1 Tax=Flammeovirga yaeyamensis TaxID=367791 RepID=A0AAX1N0R8_9BACT|nr:hypothetical protein [Flammeovirga yaeyamensis]MBB3698501.1 hypothetical protein [Flammeovirga yaeyamensis]NMF34150.1 hypothetical protein [Flammeovirga yaeyamensis]QWG01135.1 hypothetical protein KMW28_15935 [Flammeovirga yaeyamensis]
MKQFNERTLYFISLLLLLISIQTETKGNYSDEFLFEISPPIELYESQVYQAEKINWDVSIAPKGFVYFANEQGLLEFDGERWTLYPTKYNLRCVYATDNLIYVGGKKTAGYFKRINGKLEYHSIKAFPKSEEEYWKIFKYKDQLVFQTFSDIYLLTSKGEVRMIDAAFTTYAYPTDHNIIFHLVENDVITYNPKTFVKTRIKFPHVKNSKIQFIDQINADEILLGEVSHGLFVLKNGNIKPIKNKLSEQLRKYRINKGIKIGKETYAFATFDGGVIVGDLGGNIHYHIHTNNGLKNNRIHGLAYKNGYLWIASGNGIALCDLNSPVELIKDTQNKLGKIIDLISNDDGYYVATNKGVFRATRTQNNFHRFKLLLETRGQAWKLFKVEDHILCGHSHGLFKLHENSVEKINDIRGLSNVIIPPESKNVIIASNFNGLAFFNFKNEKWGNDVNHYLGGIIIKNIFALSSHKFLISTFENTLYKITFNKDYSELIENRKYQLDEWNADISRIQLTKYNDSLIVLTGKKDNYLFKNNQLNALSEEWDHISYLSPEINGKYLAVKNKSIGLFSDKWHPLESSISKLGENLVYRFNKISKIDEVIFGILLTNGIAFINSEKLESLQENDLKVEIVNYQFFDEKNNKLAKSIDINDIPANYNSVQFDLTDFQWNNSPVFEYRLTNHHQQWQDTEENSITIQNLRSGEYDLMVRIKGSTNIKRFSFTIAPRWYQSKIAYGIYFLIILLLGISIYRFHLMLLRKQKLKMLLHERSYLNQMRLMIENQKLSEQKIQLNKQVHHNENKLTQLLLDKEKQEEIINKIDKEINSIKRDKVIIKSSELGKINRIIEKKALLSENNIFVQYDRFFKALSEKHPNLKEGDLKLCGYILVNKSSKEIAPLFNITERSVELKRYRLRKKLGLEKGVTLQDYLKSI